LKNKTGKNVANEEKNIFVRLQQVCAGTYRDTRTSQTRDSTWCADSAVSGRRDTISIFRVGSANTRTERDACNRAEKS